MKTWKRVAALALGLALAVPASAAPAETNSSSEHDRAVALAARHLLTRIGTPALQDAVRTRFIRSETYWQAVFRGAGRADLCPLLWPELATSLNNVPLVNGAPAKPDVYAKAVMHGLGVMPLVSLADLAGGDRQKLVAFAQGPLTHFAETAEKNPTHLEAAAGELEHAAQETFGSAAITADFRKMAVFAADLRGNEVDFVDTKERLNEYLHVFGLHLFVEGADLERGELKLTSYLVLNKFVYALFNRPFVIYEVRPSVEQRATSALGHAEVEQGYLFLFANHIDEEVDAAQSFLNGATVGWLWNEENGQVKPIPGFTEAEANAADAAARSAFRAAAGGLLPADQYRRRLIDSIAHHEGYHQHEEPRLAEAVRRGRINDERESVLQEAGAYLYQLETCDAAFVPMNVMMILSTGANPGLPQGANAEGCRLLLSHLQRYLGDVRFWNGDEQRPIGAGVAALLQRNPGDIQKAAGQARWDLDVEAEAP